MHIFYMSSFIYMKLASENWPYFQLCSLQNFKIKVFNVNTETWGIDINKHGNQMVVGAVESIGPLFALILTKSEPDYIALPFLWFRLPPSLAWITTVLFLLFPLLYFLLPSLWAILHTVYLVIFLKETRSFCSLSQNPHMIFFCP